MTTPWESINSELIISVAERDASVSLENELKEKKKIALKESVHHKDCKCRCSHEHSHNHSAEEIFDVWGVETPRKYNEVELKSILDLLGNEKPYGMILRGKGILQLTEDSWMQFSNDCFCSRNDFFVFS